jgi:hypothetical protein
LRVFVRIRPPLPREAQEESAPALLVDGVEGSPQRVSIVPPQHDAIGGALGRRRQGKLQSDFAAKTFTFDGVFPPAATQDAVFTGAVEPQVTACLQGFNSTVFCYGPSGTGKSFTCYGPSQAYELTKGSAPTSSSGSEYATSPEAGMIPRAAQQLFGAIERGEASLEHSRFLVRCAC